MKSNQQCASCWKGVEGQWSNPFLSSEKNKAKVEM